MRRGTDHLQLHRGARFRIHRSPSNNILCPLLSLSVSCRAPVSLKYHPKYPKRSLRAAFSFNLPLPASFLSNNPPPSWPQNSPRNSIRVPSATILVLWASFSSPGRAAPYPAAPGPQISPPAVFPAPKSLQKSPSSRERPGKNPKKSPDRGPYRSPFSHLFTNKYKN